MSNKSYSKTASKESIDLNWVFRYLKDGIYPTGLNFSEKRLIRKRAERFCYLNGELYYLGTPTDRELGKKSRKVLLTHEERLKKVQECHIDAEGTHLGLEKTAEGFISDFHWVGIYRFVKDFIRQCPVCIERHPKMLQSPNTFIGYGDDTLDEEASMAWDESSVSGSEAGFTVNTNTKEVTNTSERSRSVAPVRMFWEKVDLRLFGPYKFANSSKFVLVGLDCYSLWPEAFVLDAVSPATVGQSVLSMISRYGEMCYLGVSSDDEALETSLAPALEAMKRDLDVQIILQKFHLQSTDAAFGDVEEFIGKFIKKYPKSWPESIDFCLMPLRISRSNEAEYTPSFLAHSREPVMSDKLTHSKGGNSDIQLTAKEKLNTVDLLMSTCQMLQVSVVPKALVKAKKSEDSVFTPPPSSPIAATDQLTGTSGHGHVTRSRTGNTKPKSDEMFETPTLKRKLMAMPNLQQGAKKKLKTEMMVTSTPKGQSMDEYNSDSETDVSDDPSKKAVDLDTYYQCIRQYVSGGGYPEKSSSSFKRLIRDQAKNYVLQDGDLYHEVGVKKALKKIIMTKEERAHLLRDTYIVTEAKGQMLGLLDLVHWKGKLIDCEAFLLALHSDRHESKTSKDSLRHLAEAKKQLQYDTTDTYSEIKNFIVYDVFSDDDTSKRLDYLKRQLKNFRVENDELFHAVGNKKRRVITTAANRQQIIATACQKKGASADLTNVFNLVSETAFWFAMKLDIKVYLSYMDNKHLLERYFMFREYFMQERMPERGTTEEAETESNEAAMEEDTAVETAETATATPVIAVPAVVCTKVAVKVETPVNTSKPSGVFVSSVKGKSAGDAGSPEVKISMVPAQVSSAGDAIQPQTVIPDQPLVMDSGVTEDVESEKKQIIVRLAETGATVLSEQQSSSVSALRDTAAKRVVTGASGVQQKLSDDLTVAAVKSILQSTGEPKPSADGSYTVSIESSETEQVVEIQPQPATVADDGTETSPGQLNIEIGHESETVITEEAPEVEDGESQTIPDEDIEDSDEGLYDTDEDEEGSELYDDDDSKSDISSPSMNMVTMGGEKKVVTPRQHFKCSQCDKLFFGPLKFKMHMYKHTGQKPFPCNLCSKKYTNKKSLVIHQRTHSGELPYLCSLCGKRCPSKISLKSHLKCHDGKGGGFPAKCDICQRVFSRRHLMERHKLHKHINAQSEFKCTECFKVFGHQRSLKRHFMSTHMGVKNHVCGMCGKAFCRKEYLTGHLIQHGATEGMVRKARPSTSKPRPSVFNQQYIVKKKEPIGEEEGEVKLQGSDDQMQRIFVEHDGSGNIRVLDMAMEKEVQRVLESRMTKGQVGETMVVHIEEPSTGEPQVVHVEQTEEQVVEVPIEEQGYVEYQQIDPEKSQEYVINSSAAVSGNTQYIYTTPQGEFAVQGNQELIYGQPAVQYEVECVGDVGDEEALSAINLLAQASAQQYETVISQI